MTALASACPSGLSPPVAPTSAQDPSAFVAQRDGVKSLDLIVKGASCGGCLAKIESAVTKLSGIRLARLNLSTGRLRVEGVRSRRRDRQVTVPDAADGDEIVPSRIARTAVDGFRLGGCARAQTLERHVQAEPASWYWIHRRWKTRPPGESALY